MILNWRKCQFDVLRHVKISNPQCNVSNRGGDIAAQVMGCRFKIVSQLFPYQSSFVSSKIIMKS